MNFIDLKVIQGYHEPNKTTELRNLQTSEALSNY